MTLPEGWASLSVGDVAVVNPRKSVTLAPDQDVSFVPMAAVDEVSGLVTEASVRPYREVARGFTHFIDGDVIVAKITPSMENGKAAVARNMANGTGIGSTEFHVLRSTGAVEPEFLWHFVRQKTFRDDAKLKMKGAVGQQRVPADYLKGHPIPVPPLNEQRRIVERLDSLLIVTADATEELNQIPALIDHYKRRLLALACSGDLTADWRKKTGASAWKTVKLADVAESLSYGSSAKSAKEGKTPVLRMGNIQDGRLDWTDLAYTSNLEETSKYLLRPGDVLFNRTNSPALVGKTAVFHGGRDAVYAGYLIRVRCGPQLLPDYLGYCLNSPAGRAYSWMVKSDGVNQSNINAKKLAAFSFLLPPMEEQEEIHRRVAFGIEWLDQISNECKAAVDLLPAISTAVQSKAFRGELVAQRSDDEPISVFIERLNAAQLIDVSAGESASLTEGKMPPMIARRGTVRDQLLADALSWPIEGRTFPEIAERMSRPHDELRDALFNLLSESPPRIVQHFDKTQERMVFRRGAA
jgi:type I restriction enzyme S subunit